MFTPKTAPIQFGQERLLTTDEVGQLLKVPSKTIRQWVYLKRIPNIKLNGHVRFRGQDVENWIRQGSR